MRNRIVDSTWLGRGRHVLLGKCLRARRLPRPVPAGPAPSFSLIHRRTGSRSWSFHSLTCSLVHSHVPPAAYLPTHTTALFFRLLPHSRGRSPLVYFLARLPSSVVSVLCIQPALYPSLSASLRSPPPCAVSRRKSLFWPTALPPPRSGTTRRFPLPVPSCPLARPNLAPTQATKLHE